MAIEISGRKSAPAVAGARPTLRWRWPGARIRPQERSSFTERLALLVESGVPLHAALKLLASQAESPRMRAVIEALHADVLEGRALSAALAKQPGVFSATYVNLVGAAEGGGFLHEVLRQLMELDEKVQKLRTTLVSAFVYPAFLLVLSALTVLFVLVWVFPRFAEMFESIRDRLPPTTLLLMSVSEIARAHWPWLLIGIAACAAGLLAWFRQPASRARLDRLLLSAPGLSAIAVGFYLVQTLRVLALSLGHGVPLVAALGACREVVGNRQFRRFLAGVEESVTEGKGVAVAFESATFIPPLVRQMVATGEQSGSLTLVLGRVAEFYQRDLERRLNLLAKLAEPAMLAVMGVVIGVIVASLILPVFRLAGAVH